MSITDVERDLSGYVKTYAGGRREALADALAEVVRPAVFRALIADIVGDESRLREVVARSVWHPNGFAKIVLLHSPDYLLRLHVWQNVTGSPAESRENIHNHRWDFSTVMLAGSYRHQEFQVSAYGERYLEYRYRSAADQRTYSLIPLGSQTLDCVFDVHLLQGSCYTLSSVVLHRVVPDPGQATVSLVLEGPHLASPVKVFANEEIDLGASVPFGKISPESLLGQVGAVLSLPAFA